jgi:formylglycine-generating enzyme required for sulfatase activity
MSTEWRNPYVAGSPIRGQEMFFGRDNVFEWLREHLIGQFQDNAIVLYGERRTGKTSILYQIPRRLDDPSYIPVLIDLQQLSLDSIDSFFLQLAVKIWGALRRTQGVGKLPRPQREGFDSAYFTEVFLAQVEEAIGERTLLIMLDEFSRLRTKVESGDLPADIFGYLRSLMADHRMTLVISLGSKLEQMSAEYSVLFNQAIYHRITFLDESDARALITQPVAQHYGYQEEAIDLIIKATSGHPFYVQHVCHAIFARRGAGKREPVTGQEVEQVLPEVVEATAQNLKFIWDDVRPAEKAVMAAAAALIESIGGITRQDDVARLLHDHEFCPPAGELAAALHTLRTRDILREEIVGQYAFAIEPLRLWLARERRPELVRQELLPTGAVSRWQPAPSPEPVTPWWRRPSVLPAAAMLLLILVLVGALMRQTSRLQQLSSTATAAARNAADARQQAATAAAQAMNVASEATVVVDALAGQYATATLVATQGGISAATVTAIAATLEAREAEATAIVLALENANANATVSAQTLAGALATVDAVAIQQSIPTPTPVPPAETPTDVPTPTQTSVPPTATPTDVPTPTQTSVPPSPTPTQTLATATPIPTATPVKVVTRLWEQDSSMMVLVPAGAFWMGSSENDVGAEADEKPQHLVTLDSFYIDQHEVTNAQYASFLNAAGDGTQERLWLALEAETVRIHQKEGSWRADDGYESHPVTQVSWYGAEAYCHWAGKRLPTEAEWEKAARGADQRIYPWGNEFDGTRLNFCDINCDIAEWKNTQWSDGYAQTAPVDSYADGKSPYGALNMAGNVWEWVADRYDANYYAISPSIAPQGPSTGDRYVHRGGSWDSTEWFVRVAERYAVPAPHRVNTVGFRCAFSGAEP